MTTVILYHHVRKWQKLSNQVLLGTARVSVSRFHLWKTWWDLQKGGPEGVKVVGSGPLDRAEINAYASFSHACSDVKIGAFPVHWGMTRLPRGYLGCKSMTNSRPRNMPKMSQQSILLYNLWWFFNQEIYDRLCTASNMPEGARLSKNWREPHYFITSLLEV